MPESKRRTSSSHCRESPSIRNNGIYVIGKTKIVVKNSGYMGYDIALTPGSTKGGRLSAALFLLRRPRSCLSQLQHHIQEDGTLLMCMCGTEGNGPGFGPSENRRHARSENGPLQLKSDTHDGMAGIVNDDAREASHHHNRRHSSRRSHGRSDPSSIRSHRNAVPASPPSHLRTTYAPVNVQEPQHMEEDVRRDQPMEHEPRVESREFSVLPPRAINPYARMHGDPLINHAYTPPIAREDPVLHYELQQNLLDHEQSPERPRHRLPSSASDATRGSRRTRRSSKQDSHSVRNDFYDRAGPPDHPPPVMMPESQRKSSADRKELKINWHELRQAKPEVPPKPSKDKQNKLNGRHIIPIIPEGERKAFIDDINDSPQFQRQREGVRTV